MRSEIDDTAQDGRQRTDGIPLNGTPHNGEFHRGGDMPDVNPGESKTTTAAPRVLRFDNEMVNRIAQAISNACNAKFAWIEELLKDGIEDDTEKLAEVKQQGAKGEGRAALRQVFAFALSFAGICVALAAAGSWIRWVVMATNELMLACLLASMIPVTAVGLHYWVWRSWDRTRDRAVAVVTFGLALSGAGLLAAVACRFGVEAPIITDITSLQAGDDNRWLMVTADLVGVCGSVLFMAWADDIGKSLSERIRIRRASRKAELFRLQSRRQREVDRAIKRAFRNLLKG